MFALLARATKDTITFRESSIYQEALVHGVNLERAIHVTTSIDKRAFNFLLPPLTELDPQDLGSMPMAVADISLALFFKLPCEDFSCVLVEGLVLLQARLEPLDVTGLTIEV